MKKLKTGVRIYNVNNRLEVVTEHEYQLMQKLQPKNPFFIPMVIALALSLVVIAINATCILA